MHSGRSETLPSLATPSGHLVSSIHKILSPQHAKSLLTNPETKQFGPKHIPIRLRTEAWICDNP